MDVPMDIRDIFSQENYPDGVSLWVVADGRIDQNVAIVAYALKCLSDFSENLVEDLRLLPEGCLYEQTVGYVLRQKGVRRSEDWDDHKYDGYRLVLYDYFWEGGWKKEFADGHSETLIWGYLTHENAKDVVDLLSFWHNMNDIILFIVEKFGISGPSD